MDKIDRIAVVGGLVLLALLVVGGLLVIAGGWAIGEVNELFLAQLNHPQPHHHRRAPLLQDMILQGEF